jgi:hypothetical protein
MTKFFSKKTFIFILVLILFLGLFFVNVRAAKAIDFQPALRWFIQSIFWLILQIAFFFTGLIANLFTTILDFGFEDMRTIHLGWTITRDIVNMFFILGLIVIAFANILRIESYAMKNLLAKFIIIAIIINFSYLACGIIIDSSQVITTYFLGLIKGPQQDQKPDVGMALLDSLAVTKSLIPPEGGTSSVAITNASEDAVAWQTVINVAFSAIIIAVAGFALLVGTLLLFIRIGALWALIILCPFAWFLGIFPGKLKSQADKWWSEFIKWTFFAPIYVFFIYLILQIGQAIKDQTFLTNQNMTPETFKNVSYTDMMSNWTLIFNYVLLIILLFGASQMALSMGGKAAGIGIGVVKGALKGVYKLPGRLRASMVAPPGWMKAVPGVRRVAAGLSFLAKWTTPEFWKKAMEARKVERMREARVGRHIGRQQDVMNRVLSLWTRRTQHAEGAEQFEVDEKKKEIDFETKRVGSRLIARKNQAEKEKDLVAWMGCNELLQDQGDTNDSMIFDDAFDNETYVEEFALDELKGKHVNHDEGITPKKAQDRYFDALGFKHGTIRRMRRMGINDKKIAAFLGKMQEIALAAGYYSCYGMTKADEKTGELRIATDKEQIEVAAAKIKTQTPRGRKLHGTAIGRQGVDDKGQYKYAGRSAATDAIMRTYTLADAKATQMQYTRPDAQVSLDQAFENGDLKKIGDGAAALGKKVYNEKRGIEEEGKKKPKPKTEKTEKEDTED